MESKGTGVPANIQLHKTVYQKRHKHWISLDGLEEEVQPTGFPGTYICSASGRRGEIIVHHQPTEQAIVAAAPIGKRLSWEVSSFATRMQQLKDRWKDKLPDTELKELDGVFADVSDAMHRLSLQISLTSTRYAPIYGGMDAPTRKQNQPLTATIAGVIYPIGEPLMIPASDFYTAPDHTQYLHYKGASYQVFQTELFKNSRYVNIGNTIHEVVTQHLPPQPLSNSSNISAPASPVADSSATEPASPATNRAMNVATNTMSVENKAQTTSSLQATVAPSIEPPAHAMFAGFSPLNSLSKQTDPISTSRPSPTLTIPSHATNGMAQDVVTINPSYAGMKGKPNGVLAPFQLEVFLPPGAVPVPAPDIHPSKESALNHHMSDHMQPTTLAALLNTPVLKQCFEPEIYSPSLPGDNSGGFFSPYLGPPSVSSAVDEEGEHILADGLDSFGVYSFASTGFNSLS